MCEKSRVLAENIWPFSQAHRKKFIFSTSDVISTYMRGQWIFWDMLYLLPWQDRGYSGICYIFLHDRTGDILGYDISSYRQDRRYSGICYILLHDSTGDILGYVISSYMTRQGIFWDILYLPTWEDRGYSGICYIHALHDEYLVWFIVKLES